MSKFRQVRTEEEVGILCRLGKIQRFQGDFKARFSDFHVNEIGLDGKIIQLTSLAPPVERKSDCSVDDPQICEWIPVDIRNDVSNLQVRLDEAEKSNTGKGNKIWKEEALIKVTTLSKEERTKIHKWMGNFEKLSSETVDKDGEKFIVTKFDNKNNRNRRRPSTRPKYTHFTMYKEGVDTSEAIGLLTKKLRIKPNFITFCGTKDKYGKTTQRMCVSNFDASRLVQVSRELKSIKLGNYEYLPHHLRLGDLKGNHFKILLRNVIAESEESIDAAVNSLKSTGFINYFGLQRFGSYEISTHAVGKKILQNKWIEAFDLILEPKHNDSDFMTKAKKEWLINRNPVAAVELIPHSVRSIESNVLHGLAKYYSKNDFIAVFLRLARNTRHLYIHSFQSFLWNQVATFRINELGLEPAVGDLVYVGEEQDDFYVEDILDEEDSEDELSTKEKSKGIANTLARSTRVKALTQEDIANYTIFDVLIPIQGTQIQIPENTIIRDYYEKILNAEGLDMDCFLKFRPIADQPKGAYRKLIIRPQNISHKTIPYSNSDEVDKFIPSEIDKLEMSKHEENNRNTVSETSIKDNKCVILELSLPASSYATMALREILVGGGSTTERNSSVSVGQDQTVGKRVGNSPCEEDRSEVKRFCADNSSVVNTV